MTRIVTAREILQQPGIVLPNEQRWFWLEHILTLLEGPFGVTSPLLPNGTRIVEIRIRWFATDPLTDISLRCGAFLIPSESFDSSNLLPLVKLIDWGNRISQMTFVTVVDVHDESFALDTVVVGGNQRILLIGETVVGSSLTLNMGVRFLLP